MAVNQFNVRVYGILINAEGKVLVTEEYRMGRMIAKFPGGGLEFGEGTVDCLRREFREELNMNIGGIKHFYTTDYFQPSAFNNRQQVISIYYLVSSFPGKEPEIKDERLEMTEGAQVFKWMPLKDLTVGYFTFPIDKKVAGMIIENLKTEVFGN